MCGICGIFGEQSSRERRVRILNGMLERIAHRGPDGSGQSIGPTFGVGHKRLAIIDLDTGQQPMFSPEGRFFISFNGEIYNYRELRTELQAEGIEFRTASDTEVLLAGLIAHGEAFLPRLNGMFAFIFVDTVTEEWLVSRDPMGVKPLYYCHCGSDILFASEIKAFLAHPEFKRSVNPYALNEYIAFQLYLTHQTLFNGVHRVESGTYLKGRGGKFTGGGTYWEPRFEIDESHSEKYFLEYTQSLLEDSVRLQMRSDVPVGTYLSGGLDSSLITALAAKHSPSGLKAFTGRFAEGPSYDESPHARKVAEHTGVSMEIVTPTVNEFIELLPKLIYMLDEPATGPSIFNQYIVARHASKSVRVLLGGQGADEIFGGYARYLVAYLEQALKGAIFQTSEEGTHLVTLNSIIPNLPLLQQYTPLMQQLWCKGLFERMDKRYFQLIDRSPELKNRFTDGFARQFDEERLFSSFAKIFNTPKTQSYINKMTYFDMRVLLPGLLQLEDRASMNCSIESRIPFLDTRIIDLVGSMLPPMKFKGGRTKNLLREVSERYLPDSIANRKDKMGFPTPLPLWLKSSPLREFCIDLLSSKRFKGRGIFELGDVEKLLDQEPTFGRQVWGLLSLELWFQNFIDDQPSATDSTQPIIIPGRARATQIASTRSEIL